MLSVKIPACHAEGSKVGLETAELSQPLRRRKNDEAQLTKKNALDKRAEVSMKEVDRLMTF